MTITFEYNNTGHFTYRGVKKVDLNVMQSKIRIELEEDYEVTHEFMDTQEALIGANCSVYPDIHCMYGVTQVTILK